MKLSKMKITIQTSEQAKHEILNALSGKNNKIQKKNEFKFIGVDAFVQILNKSRIEILIYLTNHNPSSIYMLAKEIDKDFKTVHTDVTKLASLGFIDLIKSGNSRNGLIPKAKFSGIEIDLAS